MIPPTKESAGDREDRARSRHRFGHSTGPRHPFPLDQLRSRVCCLKELQSASPLHPSPSLRFKCAFPIHACAITVRCLQAAFQNNGHNEPATWRPFSPTSGDLISGRGGPLGWQDKCFTEQVDTMLSSTSMSRKVLVALMSPAMTFLSK